MLQYKHVGLFEVDNYRGYVHIIIPYEIKMLELTSSSTALNSSHEFFSIESGSGQSGLGARHTRHLACIKVGLRLLWAFCFNG